MPNNTQLTEEELKHNQYHLLKLSESMENGDENAEFFHRSQIIADPDSLMTLKRTMGANWILEQSFNTTLADRKFGNDWLYR